MKNYIAKNHIHMFVNQGISDNIIPSDKVDLVAIPVLCDYSALHLDFVQADIARVGVSRS